MIQKCIRCSRANPAEASYCYFDGIGLAGHARAANPSQARFPRPFAFPSGNECSNFEQLATGILLEWPQALKMQKEGEFARFFSSIGRLDLSGVASQAGNYPAPSQGLDSLLGRLPVESILPAKLDVDPEVLDLGLLKVGQDKKVTLRIRNIGRRLLFGTIAVEGLPWLNIGDGKPRSLQRFETFYEIAAPLTVLGGKLRASDKDFEGRIVLNTSGGTLVVPVKGRVPVKPFQGGVLSGAKSPREVAQKSKANPREAILAFEGLQVQKWYAENGWDYPVPGPSATGIAGLQQFFEALGLSKPPKVSIGSTHIVFDLERGEVRDQVIPLFGDSKSPVYANVSVMVPWVEIQRVELKGTRVNILIRVLEAKMSGSSQSAFVMIQANGGQNFKVRIDARKKQSFAPGSDSPPVSTMRAYMADLPDGEEPPPGLSPHGHWKAPQDISGTGISTRLGWPTILVAIFLGLASFSLIVALILLLLKKLG